MKTKLHHALFIITVLFHSAGAFSQVDKIPVNTIRNASNLASGNFRDVLTSFFQLAYEDLSSDNRELKFSSNIFALKLKTDPTLEVGKKFFKQTWARNSNVDFSLKLDSNYKFNGAKAGYVFALVNRRDYAISKSFNTAVLLETANYMQAYTAIIQEISGLYPNDEGGKATALTTEMNNLFNSGTIVYSQLSTEAAGLVRKYLYGDGIDIKNNWSPRSDMNAIYQAIIKEYQKKLLWTVAGNTSTYKDATLLSTLDFYTEATAGIIPINDRNNIEFYAKANYSLSDDTIATGRSLGRQRFISSFGLNWVTRNRNDKPVFELKASGNFDHIFAGKYPTEKRQRIVFDAELRIRITNEIWVPVTVKYDPENGNIFGLIHARANFDLLNKLFGNLK